MTRDPGSRELAESTSCGPATHDDAQEDRGYGEHEQNVDYAPHEVKRKAEHPQDEEQDRSRPQKIQHCLTSLRRHDMHDWDRRLGCRRVGLGGFLRGPVGGA